MRDPRPHDFVEVDGLVAHSTDDAPSWVCGALRDTGWVVATSSVSASGTCVTVRGPIQSQRHAMLAPADCIVDIVSPEDIAGVRAWPIRGMPALEVLREVRAPLNHLGLRWGPIGSVGYELVSGIRSVTARSDLDLLVRLRGCDTGQIDELVALQNGVLNSHSAVIDWFVETPYALIRLTDLAAHDALRSIAVVP